MLPQENWTAVEMVERVTVAVAAEVAAEVATAEVGWVVAGTVEVTVEAGWEAAETVEVMAEAGWAVAVMAVEVGWVVAETVEVMAEAGRVAEVMAMVEVAAVAAAAMAVVMVRAEAVKAKADLAAAVATAAGSEAMDLVVTGEVAKMVMEAMGLVAAGMKVVAMEVGSTVAEEAAVWAVKDSAVEAGSMLMEVVAEAMTAAAGLAAMVAD